MENTSARTPAGGAGAQDWYKRCTNPIVIFFAKVAFDVCD